MRIEHGESTIENRIGMSCQRDPRFSICHPRLRSVRYIILLAFASVLSAGCADTNKSQPTTRPLTVREQHEAALKDPFNYGGDTENVDVSGGDTNTLDKKALKRDIDSVFNPN